MTDFVSKSINFDHDAHAIKKLNGMQTYHAATPITFKHYTKHIQGSSFGTKFEGLAVSRALPEQIPGLYHAGSVGIIMSGWLGAINYGVIVANEVDSHLMKSAQKTPSMSKKPASVKPEQRV